MKGEFFRDYGTDPIVGIKTSILNTISANKLASKPPGFFFCYTEKNLIPVQPDGPPKEEIRPVKKKNGKKDRKAYFKKWYKEHKAHKHQVYLDRKKRLSKQIQTVVNG